LALLRTNEVNCLDANPLGLLRAPDVTRITSQLANGFSVNSNCNNVTFGDGANRQNFPSVDAFKQEVTSIMTTGLSCLRALRAPTGGGPSFKATRTADELLANVFSSPERRNDSNKLRITCEVPDAKKKTAYAMGTDILDSEFPTLRLNPPVLNKNNYKQIMFHELLHMTGSNGKPHVHNYGNCQAEDRVPACAACCFRSEESINSSVNTSLNLGLSSYEALKELSCKVCAGHFDTLDKAMVAYAKTELVQGNQTSYKYAAFELRKAVLINPQNSEAWLLLAQSLNLVSPTLIERDMRIWGAYQKAIDTAASEAEKDRIKNSADYVALKNKLYRQTSTSGQTFYDLRGYKRSETTRLSTNIQDLILNFESKRAVMKMGLQSCGPQPSGSDCEARITALNNEYRLAYVQLNKANKATSRSTMEPIQISSDIIDNLKAEAEFFNDTFIPCLRTGDGDVEKCWEKSFPKQAANKQSIDAQDWRARP